MIGEIVNQFKIVKKLGEGGMGEVYLAKDSDLDRKVALKFLPPYYAKDPDINARFKREAKAAAALNHPNIITIYEIGEHEGKAYIAMEYVDGKSLRERIKEGEMSLPEVTTIANAICNGLGEAHNAGIVHRDIKPENILLDKNNNVKILDFGLAQKSGSTKLTQETSTLGTVHYMSPEQCKSGDVDARSDIWSFGVILYEMVAGKPPFDANYDQAVFYSILNEEPEPIAESRSGPQSRMAAVARKCLAKDPDNRYQSLDEVRLDFLKESKKTFPALKAIKRKVATLAILLFATVAVGVILKFFVFGESNNLPPKTMLAIVPFKNVGSSDHVYFADGITEEIFSKLSKSNELGILSRATMLPFLGSQKSLSEIGAELGAEYVLGGTVGKDMAADSDGRLRISQQLIRVSDGSTVWEKEYNTRFEEVLQVQSDIVLQVTSFLNVSLPKQLQNRLSVGPTMEIDAYKYYLRGLRFSYKSYESSDRLDAAIMFRRAISLDSSFALAHAKLSSIYTSLYRDPRTRADSLAILAKRHAKKALSLDPELPDAHRALGFYYYGVESDYLNALVEISASLQGNPNDPDAHSTLAYIYRRQGNFELALNALKTALSLKPTSHANAYEVAITCQWMRKYKEAEKYYDTAAELNPTWYLPPLQKTIMYLSWTGKTDKSWEVIGSPGIRLNPLHLGWNPTWYNLYLLDGDYKVAIDNMPKQQKQTWPRSPEFYYVSMAFSHRYMGNEKLGRAYLDSARTVLEKNIRARPKEVHHYAQLAVVLAAQGNKSQAITRISEAIELNPLDKDEFYWGPTLREYRAWVHTLVGEYEKAIDDLDILLSKPGKVSAELVRLDPKWLALDSNSRFKNLVEDHLLESFETDIE